MKKLEKLTLKEMSNEMTLINKSDQQSLIGGFTQQDLINYCWGELQGSFSSFTHTVDYSITSINNVIGTTYNSIVSAVSDFYANHQDLVIHAGDSIITGTMYLIQGAEALCPWLIIPALVPGGSDTPSGS